MYRKLGIAIVCFSLLAFSIETVLAQMSVSIIDSTGNPPSGGWFSQMTFPSVIIPAIVLIIGWLLTRVD